MTAAGTEQKNEKQHKKTAIRGFDGCFLPLNLINLT